MGSTGVDVDAGCDAVHGTAVHTAPVTTGARHLRWDGRDAGRGAMSSTECSSAVVVVHRAESVPCCFPQEHPFFHGRPLARVAGRNYPPCHGDAHRYGENMTHCSLRPAESDIVGIALIGHRKYKNIRVRRTQMLDPSIRGQP